MRGGRRENRRERRKRERGRKGVSYTQKHLQKTVTKKQHATLCPVHSGCLTTSVSFTPRMTEHAHLQVVANKNDSMLCQMSTGRQNHTTWPRDKGFECGIGVYVARDEAAEISKTEYSFTVCYFPFCSSIPSLKLLAKPQSSTILFSHYTRYRKGWQSGMTVQEDKESLLMSKRGENG